MRAVSLTGHGGIEMLQVRDDVGRLEPRLMMRRVVEMGLLEECEEFARWEGRTVAEV